MWQLSQRGKIDFVLTETTASSFSHRWIDQAVSIVHLKLIAEWKSTTTTTFTVSETFRAGSICCSLVTCISQHLECHKWILVKSRKHQRHVPSTFSSSFSSYPPPPTSLVLNLKKYFPFQTIPKKKKKKLIFETLNTRREASNSSHTLQHF